MCPSSTCIRELIRVTDAAVRAERRINNNGGNLETPESRASRVIGGPGWSHVPPAEMTLLIMTVPTLHSLSVPDVPSAVAGDATATIFCLIIAKSHHCLLTVNIRPKMSAILIGSLTIMASPWN
jgi:hypothetical protein